MNRKLQLFALAILLFLAGYSTHAAIVKENRSKDGFEDKTTEVTNSTQIVANEPLQLTVTLQKQYLDGKIEESSEKQTIYAMEDFWSMYEGWQLVDQNQEEMIFRQQVDDISPYLKQSGYFGLQNSMLSIFEGEPIHQQVIQSFYQIDTDTLESRQIEALEKGIQIESKEKYLQVLEMYRDLSPTKQVQG